MRKCALPAVPSQTCPLLAPKLPSLPTLLTMPSCRYDAGGERGPGKPPCCAAQRLLGMLQSGARPGLHAAGAAACHAWAAAVVPAMPATHCRSVL